MRRSGFCDKNGNPKEQSWLAPLEPQVIVERYNAILRGMVNDKAGIVNFSELNRWIYIIRTSCLKTLAQKYRTKRTGIYKRFGVDSGNTKTIGFKILIQYEGKTYIKNWNLLTYRDLKQSASALAFGRAERKCKARVEALKIAFEQIEKGNPSYFCKYSPSKGRTPRITDVNYLDRIHWVNARTQANFGAPCALCGESNNVEMHHPEGQNTSEKNATL